MKFIIQPVVGSGGSPGPVLKGGDSYSEDCEFKSRRQILDGHFSIKLLQHLYCLYKLKRGPGWPIKKLLWGQRLLSRRDDQFQSSHFEAENLSPIMKITLVLDSLTGGKVLSSQS